MGADAFPFVPHTPVPTSVSAAKPFPTSVVIRFANERPEIRLKRGPARHQPVPPVMSRSRPWSTDVIMAPLGGPSHTAQCDPSPAGVWRAPLDTPDSAPLTPPDRPRPVGPRGSVPPHPLGAPAPSHARVVSAQPEKRERVKDLGVLADGPSVRRARGADADGRRRTDRRRWRISGEPQRHAVELGPDPALQSSKHIIGAIRRTRT